MQTADNVARWFLSRNAARALSGETDFISNLKLQKLLYYAQGIHIALYAEPLFAEDVEAWQYGPVVEAVYQKYKANGADGIKEFTPPEENFTAKEETTLQFVQNEFGQFSAWKLAEMTHAEMPWKDTPRNETIPLERIQSYFKDNYIEHSC